METRHKILFLDDDPDVLELYKDLLSKLPSQPDVRTAASGARALALLDAEPFRLLICDLKMPKMDGLQVLSIVRRRYPELRTVVMTGLSDEEFRSRAYALGVDLFWLKPDTQQNMQMFLECLEALLGKDSESGFRGVQSKSLMDIIQMECLSQSSALLRVTRGSQVGKIWIYGGELIDAETDGARGEPAFQKILGWKSGTFETLPPEPDRERTILKPVNALLLESAQTIDEIENASSSSETVMHRKNMWRLAAMTREGVDWVVSVPANGDAEGCGTEATNEMAELVRLANETCKRLSEQLDAGPLSHLDGRTFDRHVLMLPWDSKSFLTAWPMEAEPSRLLEQTKKIVGAWDS
jgi:CheY-like chemotaxis protein